MTLVIVILITLPTIYGVNWFLNGELFIPEFLKGRAFKMLKAHARRVRKIEQDGLDAYNAIKNLSETKRRLNEQFREDWDNQFRLLLPPPETPNREALMVRPYADLRAFDRPEYSYDQTSGIRINRFLNLVPIGALLSEREWWYAFNNLPGHPHKLMFIRMSCFQNVSPKFWIMLPELKRIEGTDNEWTWPDSAMGTLVQNVKEGFRVIVS